MKAFAEQINGAKNHSELKAVGAKIYNSKKLTKNKETVITLYREKRAELDKNLVENGSTTLKQVLFHVNTLKNRSKAGIARLGMTIYEMVKTGALDNAEADLVFRAYKHQKRKLAIQ